MNETKTKDQRICLKFCASNDISCDEAFEMLQATYGDAALSETNATELYETFKHKKELNEDCADAKSSTLSAEEIVEQRVCLKFCASNKISCAGALKMLRETYGDNSISKTRAYEWYKAFKDGREEVEDKPRSGRPSTSNTQENIKNVKEIVLANPNVGIREIADTLKISYGSVQHILVDILRMNRVADSWHSS